MSDYLFHPGDLSATLDAKRKKIVEEMERLPEDYVLKVNEAEYIKQKVANETIDLLSIDSEVVVISDFEIEHKRQGHFNTYIERTPAVEVSLCYSGDCGLFKMRQNYFNEPPEGKVVGNEVRATFRIEKSSAVDSVRSLIQRWEQRIRKHIEDQKGQLEEPVRKFV